MFNYTETFTSLKECIKKKSIKKVLNNEQLKQNFYDKKYQISLWAFQHS